MDVDVNSDQTSMCRICMQESGHLYPIFDKVQLGDSGINTIADIITECTRYPVAFNDKLPTKICSPCMDAARSAHTFKRQTEQAYCRLKALYDITWVPKKEKGSSPTSFVDRYTQTEKSTVFQCESCPQKFFAENELRQHRATSHIYDGKKCRVCGEKFNHLGQLKVHLSTEHPNEGIRCDFKCQVCLREFTRKDHLKRHLVKVHKIKDEKLNISKVSLDEPEIQIDNSANVSTSLNNYSSHWPDYQEEENEAPENVSSQQNEPVTATNPFSSDEADTTDRHDFDEMDEEDVKQFVETLTHPEISIKVEPIDFMDPYSYDDDVVEQDLQKGHEFSAITPSAYQKQRDMRASFYKQHYHIKNPYDTPDDSITNTQKIVYKRNSITNKFHCQQCPLEFKLHRNLTRHMLTHTDDRPFFCDVCEKTFKRKDNLQKHLRDVHAEKNFGCDTCNKKFATHRQLLRHHETSRHKKTTRK